MISLVTMEFDVSKPSRFLSHLCLWSPTGCCVWTSVLLLLILIQMVFSGVFIHTDKALISPFYFCIVHGELYCDGFYRGDSVAESEIKINILRTMVTLCFHVPVVLVAFALLSVLLVVYAKDRSALCFSLVCQATSSLLILTAVMFFLLLYQSYVTWENMTLWFCICVGVQFELAITIMLTCVWRKRLTCD